MGILLSLFSSYPADFGKQKLKMNVSACSQLSLPNVHTQRLYPGIFLHRHPLSLPVPFDVPRWVMAQKMWLGTIMDSDFFLLLEAPNLPK